MSAVFEYIQQVLWSCCEIMIVLLPFFLLAGALQFFSALLRKAILLLTGEHLWTLLALPGTMIHELSHALFCVIFRHKITSMELFSPEGKTLGYVNHSWDPKSFYQSAGNFFIGLAPVIVGTVVIWLLTLLLFPAIPASFSGENFSSLSQVLYASWGVACQMLGNFVDPAVLCRWQSWLHLLLLLLIGSHITLSASDFKGIWLGAAALAVVIFLVSLFPFWFDPAAGLIGFCGNFMALSFALMLFTAVMLGALTILLLPFIWLKTRKPRAK